MSSLYPFRFEPLYKHYPWGGRRFESVLGRAIEPGKIHAESWEIADHGADQSVVEAGPLAGISLHQLTVERREELLGTTRPVSGDRRLAGRFPLLLKFLDAAENLSLQVHPNDEIAARLDPPDLGKTEAWFVLAAEPGSRIWAGLAPGVDENVLRRAIAEGTCADCVRWFEPAPGDAILIPAGTLHSLGGGILAAEIQQASDTTFRLFDWNRLGPDGKPRELHVEQAIEAIDFGAGPCKPVRAAATETNAAARILHCEHFVLSRWKLNRPVSMGGDGHCHLVTVLEGSVAVEGDAIDKPLRRGRTILLPAALAPVAVRPVGEAEALDVTVL